MKRRNFVKTLPALWALTEIPRLRGARIKITDVRLRRPKVVRETGTVINWVGAPNPLRIGGTSFIEVLTDQGLIGSDPSVALPEKWND